MQDFNYFVDACGYWYDWKIMDEYLDYKNL